MPVSLVWRELEIVLSQRSEWAVLFTLEPHPTYEASQRFLDNIERCRRERCRRVFGQRKAYDLSNESEIAATSKSVHQEECRRSRGMVQNAQRGS